MRSRYVDVDDRMEDLAERFRDDPEFAAEFLRRFELSWLYHENALEGVVYSGQELATALAQPTLTDATFVPALVEIRNHKKAMDLVNGVVADVSSGTRDIPGQPVQYLSPVGGSIWCLPYASDGIGGGLCVWTNGGQLLVSRTLPGVADSAAHTMLAELAALGKQASKA